MNLTVTLEEGMSRANGKRPEGIRFTEVIERTMLINGIITPLGSIRSEESAFDLLLDAKRERYFD